MTSANRQFERKENYTPEAFPDSYVEQAKPAIEELMNSSDNVFYLKQVQVLQEKHFFHWVTARADELIEEGRIKTEVRALAEGTKVKFIFKRGLRYYKRHLQRTLRLIQEYSRPEITGATGRTTEILFQQAFGQRGFVLRGENITRWGRRTWKKTGHNLDFAMEADGKVYGCEVKNTWGYIGRRELEIKMEMCDFLGLIPVFIVRAAAKSYIDRVRLRGGFTLVFVGQIYPLGQEGLVKRIREQLSLEAYAPKALPSGMIDRFMGFHRRR